MNRSALIEHSVLLLVGVHLNVKGVAWGERVGDSRGREEKRERGGLIMDNLSGTKVSRNIKILILRHISISYFGFSSYMSNLKVFKVTSTFFLTFNSLLVGEVRR